MKRTLKEGQVKTYSSDTWLVRNSDYSGWMIVVINEELGALFVQSDYGNFNYIWKSIGDQTLKEFLIGLDYDYFTRKTRPETKRKDYENHRMFWDRLWIPFMDYLKGGK